MAFEFKITIDGSKKPPIWRKVKVNEVITFDEFHEIIQVLFDWTNSHLYQFTPKGWGSTPSLVQDIDDDWGDPVSDAKLFPHGESFDASQIKINQYFTSPKQKMKYIYDFGDDWTHTIELLNMSDEKTLFPICTAGKGSGAVEDCGGIWGYYDMVEAINNPKHPEHEDYMGWIGMEEGDEWDVNEFNLQEINEALVDMWEDMFSRK